MRKTRLKSRGNLDQVHSRVWGVQESVPFCVSIVNAINTIVGHSVVDHGPQGFLMFLGEIFN